MFELIEHLPALAILDYESNVEWIKSNIEMHSENNMKVSCLIYILSIIMKETFGIIQKAYPSDQIEDEGLMTLKTWII